MKENTNDGRKLTVFIVDDEPAALKQLADDLKTLPEVGKVHTYTSSSDVSLSMLEIQPDVIFLDIEMPGKSGLDFLDIIQRGLSFPVRVVFYSAFSHYMLDALRRSAFDFLLKPYKMDELRGIVQRLCHECFERPCEGCHLTGLASPKPKVAVQTVRELLLLTVDDVLFMRYDKATRAWHITLTDGSSHRLHQCTKAEDLLGFHDLLTRISSCCIVNVSYLAAVENATLRLRMVPPFDDLELYASRRYFSRLREKFELL